MSGFRGTGHSWDANGKIGARRGTEGQGHLVATLLVCALYFSAGAINRAGSRIPAQRSARLAPTTVHRAMRSHSAIPWRRRRLAGSSACHVLVSTCSIKLQWRLPDFLMSPHGFLGETIPRKPSLASLGSSVTARRDSSNCSSGLLVTLCHVLCM